MKKILLLAALVLASLQLTAANVDLATAQQSAQRFLMSKATNGRFMTSAPTVKWTHEVKNSNNAALAAFYIVSTDNGYVIVSGDDRAREILAYGDGQLDNLNDLPEAVQYFLDIYQKQMEYLQAHPGLKAQTRSANRGISVEPLLKSAWSQAKPYNMKTPKKGYGSDPYCKVGCAAVALAQVMYKWNFPVSSPALPGYVTETHGYVMDPLPEYTFDYESLLYTYRSYTDQYTDKQLDAIGYLMLYTGYAMNMDYATDRSGAEYEEIDQAIRTFGFDPGYSIEMKWDYDSGFVNYTEEEWGQLIQSELLAGRPLIYCAFDMASDSTGLGGGHAFNVDGYDADNDMYHVNFGMSEELNTYYALDAFTIDNGMTIYDFFPLLFAGVQPPTGPAVPRMIVSPTTLNMECYAGYTTTAEFNVAGIDLTDAITVTVNDTNGYFTTDVATIAVNEAGNKTVTVTYAPQEVGEHTATITLSTPGALDVTVNLSGKATAAPLVKYDPVMLPADSAAIAQTSFRADWTDQTAAQNVLSYTLDVKIKPNYTTLAEADWTNTEEVFTNQSASWQSSGLFPEGWTFNGDGLWAEDNFMSIKNATFSIPEFSGYDKVTVVFTGKGMYGSANVNVATSQASQTLLLANNSVQQYVVVLDCADVDNVSITATNGYAGFYKLAVYSGEIDPPASLRADVQGDSEHYIISGITEKSYMVENLIAEATYMYKVKAFYSDGTESAWSNIEEVTLFDNGPAPHGFEPGDVNHDGGVTIGDVSVLIDVLMGNNSTACTICADVNGDKSVTIGDISALIDILLNSH